MGAGNYFLTNQHEDRNIDGYHPIGDVPPPEEAKDIKECGCYVLYTFESSERMRDFSSTNYTNHYLCEKHMEEREKNMKLREQSYKKKLEEQRQLHEKSAQEKKSRDKLWKERCEKARPCAHKEKEKLRDLVHSLEVKKLRDIRTYFYSTDYRCTTHRGYMLLHYPLWRHSNECPVKDESAIEGYENRQCTCFPIRGEKFLYSKLRNKGYVFKIISDL